jgi:hypothetical protein
MKPERARDAVRPSADHDGQVGSALHPTFSALGLVPCNGAGWKQADRRFPALPVEVRGIDLAIEWQQCVCQQVRAHLHAYA